MKYISFILLIVLNTCNSKKSKSMMHNFSQEKTVTVTNCPKGGTCHVEILKNKSLTLKKDGVGKIFPQITDGENNVVKFVFKAENKGNYADGNTSETIHFEINENVNEELKDTDLQKIKLMYGKHFFNRSLAGYYKVLKGSFKPSKNKKQIDIVINIPILEGLQKVQNITIQLD